jgi:hypothetical protein
MTIRALPMGCQRYAHDLMQAWELCRLMAARAERNDRCTCGYIRCLRSVWAMARRASTCHLRVPCCGLLRVTALACRAWLLVSIVRLVTILAITMSRRCSLIFDLVAARTWCFVACWVVNIGVALRAVAVSSVHARQRNLRLTRMTLRAESALHIRAMEWEVVRLVTARAALAVLMRE